MSIQGMPQPAGVTGDAAQQAAQVMPQQAQPPQPAQPQQPTSGGLFDKVLGALAGSPKKYSVDQNGQETSAPVTDRGSLAKHIVAAALVGLLKGAGERGPNSMGMAAAQGGQAGFALATGEDQNARQEPLENYQRAQDAATAKANALEKNLRMRNIAQTLADADKNTHDQVVQTYAPQLQQLKDESPNQILGENIPESEAKDPQKYSLTAQRIPDGVVPRVGPDGQQEKDADGVPQWEQTYSIVDSNAKVNLTGADGKLAPWAEQAAQWGLPGYSEKAVSGLGNNQQVSIVAANHVQHLLAGLQAMQGEVNAFRSKIGLGAIDLQGMVKSDPSLIPAIEQFQRTSGASTQPDVQVDAMRQDKQASPYVSRIMGLFGQDNLEKYKESRVADQAALTEQKKKEVDANTPQAKQQERLHNLDEQLKTLEIQAKQQSLKDQQAGVQEWKPKVSADEKKKAELAENIGKNANDVALILARNPKLVGAVAGRFTNTEQMIGTDDPDISSLGTEIHNIAIASVGIHGMRSSEEVSKVEQNILNRFRNGPRAIAGSLKSLTDSVQTFVDDARPEGYKTHSKSMGVLRGMQ